VEAQTEEGRVKDGWMEAQTEERRVKTRMDGSTDGGRAGEKTDGWTYRRGRTSERRMDGRTDGGEMGEQTVGRTYGLTTSYKHSYSSLQISNTIRI
jgi:hypothetical protein